MNHQWHVKHYSSRFIRPREHINVLEDKTEMNQQVHVDKKQEVDVVEEVKSVAIPKRKMIKPKWTRPSLSEQLAKIGNEASSITKSLTEKYPDLTPKNKPLFQLPALNFIVGKLQSRFPSPVQFFQNRCEYIFHHPFENKQITMVMYFSDMSQVALSKSKCYFQFKISRDLFHYGKDYDFRNSAHFVRIDLHSQHDATQIQQVLLKR